MPVMDWSTRSSHSFLYPDERGNHVQEMSIPDPSNPDNHFGIPLPPNGSEPPVLDSLVWQVQFQDISQSNITSDFETFFQPFAWQVPFQSPSHPGFLTRMKSTTTTTTFHRCLTLSIIITPQIITLTYHCYQAMKFQYSIPMRYARQT